MGLCIHISLHLDLQDELNIEKNESFSLEEWSGDETSGPLFYKGIHENHLSGR